MLDFDLYKLIQNTKHYVHSYNNFIYFHIAKLIELTKYLFKKSDVIYIAWTVQYTYMYNTTSQVQNPQESLIGSWRWSLFGYIPSWDLNKLIGIDDVKNRDTFIFMCSGTSIVIGISMIYWKYNVNWTKMR